MLLELAIVFAVAGLIALVLGAKGVASLTFGVAKFFLAIFLIIAVVLLIAHILR